MWWRARTHSRLIRFVAFHQLEDSFFGKCSILTERPLFIICFFLSLFLGWLCGRCCCDLWNRCVFYTNVDVRIHVHKQVARCVSVCAQHKYMSVITANEWKRRSRARIHTRHEFHYLRATISDMVRRNTCVRRRVVCCPYTAFQLNLCFMYCTVCVLFTAHIDICLVA